MTGPARSIEHGNVTVFAALVTALVSWVVILVVQLGVALDDRVRLQSAADAAALAAVGAAVEGRAPVPAAARIAAANGARLERCSCPPFAGQRFDAVVTVSSAVLLPLVGESGLSVTAAAEYEIPQRSYP